MQKTVERRLLLKPTELYTIGIPRLAIIHHYGNDQAHTLGLLSTGATVLRGIDYLPLQDDIFHRICRGEE